MGTEEVGKKEAELKIDALCSSVLSIPRIIEKQLENLGETSNES